jgi:hypothetical protein
MHFSPPHMLHTSPTWTYLIWMWKYKLSNASISKFLQHVTFSPLNFCILFIFHKIKDLSKKVHVPITEPIINYIKVTIIQYKFKNLLLGTSAKCRFGISYSLNTTIHISEAKTSCCKMSPAMGWLSYYKKNTSPATPLSILNAF